MAVLVDTSVWVDYFRGGRRSEALDFLIDENLVLVNAVILAELLPSVRLKGQHRLAGLLQEIECLPEAIDWAGIMDMQLACLSQGVNGVGIPDLIIAQSARNRACPVYSLDRHFIMMAGVFELQLFQSTQT